MYIQAIILYLLKTIVYSGVLFCYYYIVLRNKQFHYYNRFYLLMSVAVSVTLPFLNIALWQVHSSNPPVMQLMNIVMINRAELSAGKTGYTIPWSMMAVLLYSAVSAGMFLMFAVSLFKLYYVKRSYPAEQLDAVVFIHTDLRQAPFSFFNYLFWKNTIDVTSETGKQIFKHELTHIKEKHSWDKLFLKIATIFLWLNPFYWLIQKELSLIHEFIADEKAIANKNAEAFALMLLQAQYGKNIFSPAQSFNYSPIKRRLLMLTTSSKESYSYARRMLVLPLLAGTILLFAFRLKDNNYPAASPHTNATVSIAAADTTIKTPLYFLDGKEITAVDLNKIDPATIEAINVLKDSLAVKQYGEKGKNGVVLIIKRKAGSTPSTPVYTPRAMPKDTIADKAAQKALKVVDDKIVTNDEVLKLDPNKIESVNVLKGDDAVKKYGEKGRNGVIEIKTKKN